MKGSSFSQREDVPDLSTESGKTTKNYIAEALFRILDTIRSNVEQEYKVPDL